MATSAMVAMTLLCQRFDTYARMVDPREHIVAQTNRIQYPTYNQNPTSAYGRWLYVLLF